MVKQPLQSIPPARSSNIFRDHIWEISVGLVAIVAISAVALNEAYCGDALEAVKAGQFGDFVGGYIGTLVLVISVAAFLASYRH